MYRRLTIIAMLTTVVAAIAATPVAFAVTAPAWPTSTQHMLAAAMTVGLGPAAPTGAQARVKLPEPIYFWASVANTIRAPGQPPLPEVIHPSGILLFADGSWVIEHLHWKGWGSSTAHASGVSSASNGIPNQAQGKRTNTPGQITLSHPGRFYGREVYRCFALTVPTPATDLHGCLEGHGGYYYFS